LEQHISKELFIYSSVNKLVFLIVSFLPQKIFAASNWGATGCLQQGDVATIQCLVPLFSNLVVSIVQLAGVALFLVFIIAGFQFITAGGNPKQLELAKNTLTYAIIGIVVIVSAYLILRIIQELTGVDVTGFTIPE
jgi:exosortase/archaeosortase